MTSLAKAIMEPEPSAQPVIIVKSSMLYSILPSALQSRLPRIPSLRRSSGFDTGRSSRSNSSASSGATTPNMEYRDALALRVFDPAQQSGLALRQNDATRRAAEDDSEIDWKFANQGVSLLGIAVNESATLGSRSADASFTRQLYLHALAYLLRGLPRDLTVEEQLSLRSSLPPGIVEPNQIAVHNSNSAGTNLPTERSLLHRTLASSIVGLFVLIQFILPYFTYVLAATYQYDREHKIVQRGVAQGMELLEKAGKTSLALGSGILEMGDGKVGQLVGEVTKWVVDGVAGGIQEGVGEVIILVGTGNALLKK